MWQEFFVILNTIYLLTISSVWSLTVQQINLYNSSTVSSTVFHVPVFSTIYSFLFNIFFTTLVLLSLKTPGRFVYWSLVGIYEIHPVSESFLRPSLVDWPKAPFREVWVNSKSLIKENLKHLKKLYLNAWSLTTSKVFFYSLAVSYKDHSISENTLHSLLTNWWRIPFQAGEISFQEYPIIAQKDK